MIFPGLSSNGVLDLFATHLGSSGEKFILGVSGHARCLFFSLVKFFSKHSSLALMVSVLRTHWYNKDVTELR